MKEARQVLCAITCLLAAATVFMEYRINSGYADTLQWLAEAWGQLGDARGQRAARELELKNRYEAAERALTKKMKMETGEQIAELKNDARDRKIYIDSLEKQLAEVQTNLVTQQEVRAVAVRTAPRQWRQLVSFRGNATTRTEWFTVTGSDWRVRYSLENAGAEDSSRIMSAIAKGTDEFELINTDKASVDTVYGHTPGRYYIDILCDNFDWEMTVEEYR